MDQVGSSALDTHAVFVPRVLWRKLTHVCLALILGLIAVTPARSQTILYVNDDAPAGGNGLSWTTAYTDLQSALTRAEGLSQPGSSVEIWVAPGRYVPTQRREATVARTATFRLLSGVRILGGFVGNEQTLAERRLSNPLPILSGDVLGNDSLLAFGGSDNVYHVVDAAGTDATAVLDGFIIQHGVADRLQGQAAHLPDSSGGGLVALGQASANIRNCVFRLNRGISEAGAVFITGPGSMSFINCRFINNRSQGFGGAIGANTYALPGSGYNLTIHGCEFAYNYGNSGAAALSLYSTPPLPCTVQITNSTFYQNQAGSARLYGNAIDVAGPIVCRVQNCIIDETLTRAAAILNDAVFEVTSCLIRGGTPALYSEGAPPATVLQSSALVGSPFVNPVGVDAVAGTIDDDFSLAAGAQALDAGSNALVPTNEFLTIAGRERIWDGDNNGTAIVDIGAWERDSPEFVPRLYVSQAAGPQGDGRSWATPLRGSLALQTALSMAASASGRFLEIWVAAGTYKPSQPVSQGGSRSASFSLVNGVGIYGGFQGNETTLTQRPPMPLTVADALNPAAATVLSGDLNGDDLGDINRDDNTFSLTSASSISTRVVIDRITLARSNADAAGGGASRISNSNMTWRDCWFVDNRVTRASTVANGGAISVVNGGGRATQVFNCKFFGNRATNLGGAIYVSNSPLYVADSTFTDNQVPTGANVGGGAIFAHNGAVAIILQTKFRLNRGHSGGAIRINDGALVTAINSEFVGNQSLASGGAVYLENNGAAASSIANCIFVGNSAPGAGSAGGAIAALTSSVSLANVTAASNPSDLGGAIYATGGWPMSLANCVIWGNPNGASWGGQEAQLLRVGGTASTITATSIQGWSGSYGGVLNDGLDPLFLRTPVPGPDQVWGTLDDDYGDLRLSSSSPCIDSGDSFALPSDGYDLDGDGNTTESLPLDLARQPRFFDDTTRANTGNGSPPVDRGAYENNLATTTWNDPFGGRFDDATNWFGGLPNSTVRAIFNSDVGLNRVYTVTMPTNQSAYSLSVLSNLVTINLRGLTTSGNLTLASPGNDQNAPSLLVSGPASVPTGLSITNTGTSLRSVFGSNAVIAAASDSAGELTVSGLRASLLLSDALDAGLAGSSSLRVINRGQLSAATLRTGVNAAATSLVQVTGVNGVGESLLALGGPGADELVISSRGTTTLQVQNEGVVAGLDVLDRTVFAEHAGSIANITISGTNTIWDTSQDDLIIARGGTANLVVTNGATLNTATANRIVLGELDGSVANITIGPGSSWNESVQSVVLAGQGTANINMLPGSSLNFQSNLVINPAGSVSGSGTITGGVFNVGTVRVGNSPGELTILGDYRQLPAQNDPDPTRANRSGTLEMEIAGTSPGQFDRLIVTGDVDLGGGLVVNLAPDVVLPESGVLEIVSGARGNTRFDVALLPTIGLDRFARVIYGNADEPIAIGVQPIQAPFNPGEPRGTAVNGTPSAVVVADFNGDDAPDLAIAVPNVTPTNAGQVFVFRNAGTIGGIWQGFESVLQLNTGIDPSDIDAADMDGDGQIDLVVSNRGSDSLSRYRNAAAGASFVTQAPLPVGDGPSSVSAVVLYSDSGTNLPDLIVSNENAGTILLLQSNDAIGGPTITPRQTITVPGRPKRTRPSDMDDDKRNEAVTLIASDGSAGSVDAVIPIVRTSPTLFGLLAPVPVAADPQDLVVANISAVPTPDVAVVCASGAISVLRNQLLPQQPIGSQPFAPAVNLPVQGAALDIAAYDIDADGDNDLAVVLSSAVRDVYTLRNVTDDATTISLATPQPANTGANPLLVSGADVDGSGVVDVIHLGPPPPGRCPECLGGDNLFVLPAGSAGCDSIDFNRNEIFPEDQDVLDFLDVLAGGVCATCADIDFNNNGIFPEDQDVLDFLNVLAGGTCP